MYRGMTGTMDHGYFTTGPFRVLTGSPRFSAVFLIHLQTASKRTAISTGTSTIRIRDQYNVEDPSTPPATTDCDVAIDHHQQDSDRFYGWASLSCDGSVGYEREWILTLDSPCSTCSCRSPTIDIRNGSQGMQQL